ncbi:MAG: stage II sporulation protein E, partial [Clostridiales bacterium]|jgi:stage II sporulation protein E|nr:stage II sporulation protein E [Clostridiales bacterium]
MNPFVLAYSGRFLGKGYKLHIITALSALGIITRFEGLLMFKYLSALVLVNGAQLIFNAAGARIRELSRILIPSLALLFSSILYVFLYGAEGYLIVMSLVECAFTAALNIIMRQGINVFTDTKGEAVIDNEALISVALILGAAVAGASDMTIGPFSLKYALCAYISLTAAYKGGAPVGAMCGVVLGFIMTLIGYFNYSLIGVLSVAAVIAGVLRGGGKMASLMGFIAGGVLSSLYLDPVLLNRDLFYAFFAASFFYWVTPKNLSLSLDTFAVKSLAGQSNKARELMKIKLLALSESFRNVGYVFSRLSDKKELIGSRDMSRFIDDMAAAACIDCENNEECWGKNFYKAYQMSLSLVEIYEKTGHVDVAHIPAEYAGFCKYTEYYAGCLERFYERAKLNQSWKNQIAESKELISRQFIGIADIMRDSLTEIETCCSVNEELDEKISAALKKRGIEVSDLIAAENSQGKINIRLTRKNCGGRKSCINDMAEIISETLGRHVVSENRRCINPTGLKCEISYREDVKLHVVSGAASVKKDNSHVSGDSHSVVEVNDSCVVLALSDGMGSGSNARSESQAAIELLESFLAAGFSKEMAVQMINSVLVLKSGDDSFSTMDICSINLHTGMADFVKIGAVSTFIKRGQNVSCILSDSLPLGVINDADIRSTQKKLKDGDLIIMVTDGVTDASGTYGGKSWVVGALCEFEGSNPQDVADYIIKKAVKMSKGSVKDDMTVLCARVWEKIV